MSSSLKPYAVVQLISVRWSKRSRGGPLAVCRAQIARSLPLPNAFQQQNPGRWLLMQSEFCERNRFEQPTQKQTVTANLDPLRLGEVAVRFDPPTSLKVTYSYSDGAPPRGYRDTTGTWIPTTQELTSELHNSWITLSYNRRLSDIDTGEWWYELHTVNAGLFEKPPSSDLFTVAQPDKELQLIDRLW